VHRKLIYYINPGKLPGLLYPTALHLIMECTYSEKTSLPEKPGKFLVHVSADNRYKLFVNEQFISFGPTRGDIAHWNYETIDIAPYLKAGDNTVAALVWNEGEHKPEAQISYKTGFLMQG
jgi:hypothetical protein